MINQGQAYKVTDSYGVTLVTYDSYRKAQQFVVNASKDGGLKLQIKNNEITRGNKNVRA